MSTSGLPLSIAGVRSRFLCGRTRAGSGEASRRRKKIFSHVRTLRFGRHREPWRQQPLIGPFTPLRCLPRCNHGKRGRQRCRTRGRKVIPPALFAEARPGSGPKTTGRAWSGVTMGRNPGRLETDRRRRISLEPLVRSHDISISRCFPIPHDAYIERTHIYT